MIIRTFFSLMLIWFSFSLVAQVETLAELQFEGTGKKIILHDYSGIPIIQTTKSYTGIHPTTHEKIWEVARSSTAAALEATDSDSGNEDFIDLYQTPYAYLNGTIIHVQTGKILVDAEKDEIKRFMEYYIVPDADLILVQLGAKGKVRLYGLDPFTNERKWDIDLRDMGLVGQAVSITAGSSYTIPPMLTANGDLLYHNDKYLASINLSNGNLNWNEKLNPGYIFINDDATKLIVAEKRGAIGGAMSMTAATGGAPRKFSKKMYLIDANTGQSLWSKGDTKMDGNIQFIMPHDGGYVVVHDEGFNIFDYNTGKEAEGRWKKDVSIKNIKDIVLEDEGFMVYYKNRRMLVDPATGEELWKKDEKLEKERKAYTMSPRASYNKIGTVSYFTSGGRIYVTVNGKTRNYECEGFVVNEDKMELVTYVTIYIEVQGVRKAVGFYARGINLNTGESDGKRFDVRKGIDAVDVVGDGYFFYNDRGYALLDFKDGEWSNLRREYYPDPSRGERFLKGAVLLIAGSTAAVRSGTTALVSNKPGAAKAYNARMDAIDMGSEASSSLYIRKIVGRVEVDFAYFFSRNDDGDLVLFKVDKNTGEEVKEYPFDDNQPVYEIDSENNQLYYLVGGDFKIFAL